MMLAAEGTYEFKQCLINFSYPIPVSDPAACQEILRQMAVYIKDCAAAGLARDIARAICARICESGSNAASPPATDPFDRLGTWYLVDLVLREASHEEKVPRGHRVLMNTVTELLQMLPRAIRARWAEHDIKAAAGGNTVALYLAAGADAAAVAEKNPIVISSSSLNCIAAAYSQIRSTMLKLTAGDTRKGLEDAFAHVKANGQQHVENPFKLNEGLRDYVWKLRLTQPRPSACLLVKTTFNPPSLEKKGGNITTTTNNNNNNNNNNNTADNNDYNNNRRQQHVPPRIVEQQQLLHAPHAGIKATNAADVPPIAREIVVHAGDERHLAIKNLAVAAALSRHSNLSKINLVDSSQQQPVLTSDALRTHAATAAAADHAAPNMTQYQQQQHQQLQGTDQHQHEDPLQRKEREEKERDATYPHQPYRRRYVDRVRKWIAAVADRDKMCEYCDAWDHSFSQCPCNILHGQGRAVLTRERAEAVLIEAGVPPQVLAHIGRHDRDKYEPYKTATLALLDAIFRAILRHNPSWPQIVDAFDVMRFRHSDVRERRNLVLLASYNLPPSKVLLDETGAAGGGDDDGVAGGVAGTNRGGGALASGAGAAGGTKNPDAAGMGGSAFLRAKGVLIQTGRITELRRLAKCVMHLNWAYFSPFEDMVPMDRLAYNTTRIKESESYVFVLFGVVSTLPTGPLAPDGQPFVIGSALPDGRGGHFCAPSMQPQPTDPLDVTAHSLRGFRVLDEHKSGREGDATVAQLTDVPQIMRQELSMFVHHLDRRTLQLLPRNSAECSAQAAQMIVFESVEDHRIDTKRIGDAMHQAEPHDFSVAKRILHAVLPSGGRGFPGRGYTDSGVNYATSQTFLQRFPNRGDLAHYYETALICASISRRNPNSSNNNNNDVNGEEYITIYESADRKGGKALVTRLRVAVWLLLERRVPFCSHCRCFGHELRRCVLRLHITMAELFMETAPMLLRLLASGYRDFIVASQNRGNNNNNNNINRLLPPQQPHQFATPQTLLALGDILNFYTNPQSSPAFPGEYAKALSIIGAHFYAAQDVSPITVAMAYFFPVETRKVLLDAGVTGGDDLVRAVEVVAANASLPSNVNSQLAFPEPCIMCSSVNHKSMDCPEVKERNMLPISAMMAELAANKVSLRDFCAAMSLENQRPGSLQLALQGTGGGGSILSQYGSHHHHHHHADTHVSQAVLRAQDFLQQQERLKGAAFIAFKDFISKRFLQVRIVPLRKQAARLAALRPSNREMLDSISEAHADFRELFVAVNTRPLDQLYAWTMERSGLLDRYQSRCSPIDLHNARRKKVSRQAAVHLQFAVLVENYGFDLKRSEAAFDDKVFEDRNEQRNRCDVMQAAIPSKTLQHSQSQKQSVASSLLPSPGSLNAVLSNNNNNNSNGMEMLFLNTASNNAIGDSSSGARRREREEVRLLQQPQLDDPFDDDNVFDELPSSAAGVVVVGGAQSK